MTSVAMLSCCPKTLWLHRQTLSTYQIFQFIWDFGNVVLLPQNVGNRSENGLRDHGHGCLAFIQRLYHTHYTWMSQTHQLCSILPNEVQKCILRSPANTQIGFKFMAPKLPFPGATKISNLLFSLPLFWFLRPSITRHPRGGNPNNRAKC